MVGQDKQNKLLVGSCGGLTGVYLLKQYSEYPSLEIWGAECADDSVGKFFVDHLVCVPPSNDASFVDSLIEIINVEHIDFYIPTHSDEFRAVARNEARIRANTNCSFLVSPYETFLALENKDIALENLRNLGIPAPEQILKNDASNVAYPVFMKKRRGSGSRGSCLISAESIFLAVANEDHDALFFQYLKGREFTIDCMFNTEGVLLGYNQRERIKTLGGAVSITSNCFEVDIEPYLRKMAANWVFRGCVNFQYILVEGTPYFIDINLRYPSGGLALTVESGLNIPEMTIRLLRDEYIRVGEYASDRKKRTMYRYYDELFE